VLIEAGNSPDKPKTQEVGFPMKEVLHAAEKEHGHLADARWPKKWFSSENLLYGWPV
jgi:hypothetical protein